MTREEAIKTLKTELNCLSIPCENCDCATCDYFVDEDEYVSACKLAIAALREQPRWISVEERLPEESGRYIVLRKSGDCLDCQYEKDRDNWGVLIDMGEVGAIWVDYNGVTHWMPMPEPQKEEA